LSPFYRTKAGEIRNVQKSLPARWGYRLKYTVEMVGRDLRGAQDFEEPGIWLARDQSDNHSPASRQARSIKRSDR
jgi:hypothetical protein